MTRRTSRGSFVLLALLGAVSISLALKAALQLAGRFPFNADEAIVALMARHILQGKAPLFFYGQAYMGSLDAYLVAAAFGGLGEQVWVIRLVQALLYAGTLLTTALLGKRISGNWKVGILAAWLLAIPAVNVTLYTTVSLGGYAEMLLIGNVILLVAMRIGDSFAHDAVAGRRQPGFLFLLFGFFAGLGLWAFGLTLVYTLPAAIYIGWKALAGGGKAALRKNLAGFAAGLVLGVAGLVTGSAPWWLFATRYGLARLISELAGGAISGVEAVAWPAQVGRHMLNLALFGGTVLAGIRPPWSMDWLGFPLTVFFLAFWLAVLLSTFATVRWAVSRRAGGHPGPPVSSGGGGRRFLAIVPAVVCRPATAEPAAGPGQAARISRFREGVLLLASVGLALSLGFVLTPFGADPSGRYFLPLAVIWALFAALFITRLEQVWGRRALLLAGMVLVFNLWGTLQVAARFPPGFTTQFDAETRLDHRYDAELMAFLRRQDERLGFATYWVSYPLAFLSREELIFVPRLPYHSDLRYTSRDDRYAPYGDLVARAERAAFITMRQPSLDAKLRAGFDRLGITWEESQIGDYHVYYHLSRKVRPEDLGLGVHLGSGAKP